MGHPATADVDAANCLERRAAQAARVDGDLTGVGCSGDPDQTHRLGPPGRGAVLPFERVGPNESPGVKGLSRDVRLPYRRVHRRPLPLLYPAELRQPDDAILSPEIAAPAPAPRERQVLGDLLVPEEG